jgi:adenine phosphoribosyltransferase
MRSVETRIREAIRDIPDFPQPGILFKDITPILADHELCRDIVDELHGSFIDKKVDGIVGVESRGFLFGLMLAQKFNVPFIPVRKKGKLPYKTISFEYTLEYGSAVMEMHSDAIRPGTRMLVHDDLLATGGTAGAAAELIRMQDAEVAGFAFLVGLDFLPGKKFLEKYSDQVRTLVSFS